MIWAFAAIVCLQAVALAYAIAVWITRYAKQDSSPCTRPPGESSNERQGRSVGPHGGWIGEDGREYGWVDDRGNAHNDPSQDNRYD